MSDKTVFPTLSSEVTVVGIVAQFEDPNFTLPQIGCPELGSSSSFAPTQAPSARPPLPKSFFQSLQQLQKSSSVLAAALGWAGGVL